jgi:hypothetical protein
MHYARKHKGDIDDFFMVACSLKYMITNRYEDRKIALNKRAKKKKGLSTHGLPKRSPTLVLTMPEAA